MIVLIPILHKFFRKFGRISGSWRLSFFVKLGPCHPDNFKAAFPIYSIFNILHSSIIPRLHQFFRKFRKISRSWRLSLFLFRQIRKNIVTLITSKPLIRYTQYSAYCMLVLILHQFCRKFWKISGS